ncbi:MAG TPA: hypothetical protein VG848_03765, partial [Acetobacteraceae bacterium]|nr:hypothetical protein [Acetobacteraceae bacterium]
MRIAIAGMDRSPATFISNSSRLITVSHSAEQAGKILKTLCHDVDHMAFALHPPAARHHARRRDNLPLPLEHV